MPLILRPLQAITNAPECYDYGWMRTVIDNIAVDDRGRLCRLVQNEDEWHFRQQLLRYGSGLHLAIDVQKQLDDFVRHGWLKLTDTPIPIHRIKVDLSRRSTGRMIAGTPWWRAWISGVMSRTSNTAPDTIATTTSSAGAVKRPSKSDQG